jgi:hypothetical protein
MSEIEGVSMGLVEIDWFFIVASFSLLLALIGLRSTSLNSKLYRTLTFLMLMIFPAVEILGVYLHVLSVPAA